MHQCLSLISTFSPDLALITATPDLPVCVLRHYQPLTHSVILLLYIFRVSPNTPVCFYVYLSTLSVPFFFFRWQRSSPLHHRPWQQQQRLLKVCLCFLRCHFAPSECHYTFSASEFRLFHFCIHPIFIWFHLCLLCWLSHFNVFCIAVVFSFPFRHHVLALLPPSLPSPFAHLSAHCYSLFFSSSALLSSVSRSSSFSLTSFYFSFLLPFLRLTFSHFLQNVEMEITQIPVRRRRCWSAISA